jgi:alginate O-acetyltransferase complex protein AlgI
MLFTSPEFVFLFLPVTFFGFWALSLFNPTLTITWLVVASIFFYGYWNVTYLWLLIPSIICNYIAGRMIASLYGRARYATAAIAVAGNLGVLLYFKYTNFLVTNLGLVLGTPFTVPKIVLPLGVSFITFQKIAYIVDVYRGKVRDRGLLGFALFVSFFPQLIAGPIAHHSEILPQLDRSIAVRLTNVAGGLSLFAVGLFKKVMVADGISGIANAGFDAAAHGSHLAFGSAWASAIAYTIQLYFDFSGYSDMACGLGLMFGIRLPINFFSPYKAASIIDFWRRWHMTLSRFLRDYLYIPLGGNRRGPLRRWLNLLITMTLGGLWHGAGWTFMIWGTYHAMLLMINHAWRSVSSERLQHLRVPTPLAIAATFTTVVFGWVLFRSDSIAAAATMFESLFDVGPAELTDKYTPQLAEWAELVAVLASIWLLPNSYQIFASVNPALGEIPAARLSWTRWQPTAIWAVIIASCLAMTMMPNRPPLSFLYFQF